MKWLPEENRFVLTDRSRPLNFKPLGCLFILDLENWMTLSVAIKRRMVLEGNGYSATGKFETFKAFERGAPEIKDGTNSANLMWVAQDAQTSYSNIEAMPENLRAAGRAFTDGKPHFRIPFYLGDGSEDRVITKEEYLDDYNDKTIHLPARNRSANTPQKLGKYYLLWLMKRDPYPGQTETTQGRAEVNVIYASAEVDDPQRTTFVPNKSAYSYNYDNTVPPVHQWKPKIGSRYIISTIPQGAEAGKVQHLKLRMVRPVMPIEYSGTSISAVVIRNDTFGGRWHYPYEAELVNLVRVPTYYLVDTPRAPFDKIRYKDEALGWVIPYFSNDHLDGYNFGARHRIPDYVHIPYHWEIKGLTHAFSRYNNGSTIYAIMYRSDRKEDGSWSGQTNNLMVAARMTIGRRLGIQNITGKYDAVYIEHYYLGPNLYLGTNVKNLISYAMSPIFWERIIDKDAIVTREVPFRDTEAEDYWYRYHVQPNAEGYNLINITSKGITAWHRHEAYKRVCWPFLNDQLQPW